MKKHRFGGQGLWSAVEWKEIAPLIKGDHPGQVEGRKKCIRPSDGLGVSEFDGHAALTMFGDFWLYARSNPKIAGHRAVQCCSGTLSSLGPFRMCHFQDVPADSDIYFLHPYVLPKQNNGILALLSLVWPPKDPRKACIYMAIS